MRLRIVFGVLLISSLCAISAAAKRPAGPKLATPSMEHSFGEVKAGTPLTYTFEIRNLGDADLVIKSVEPSCGCTTSSFDKVIKAGHKGGITLSVEKTAEYKGDVVKTAAVTTNDPERGSFILTLKATFKAE
ncbi:MAG TPA: DUF1573 domain-containing protein [Blastocatellia bacterium]|nr:DUF1573 domain-containing protein [Blastocatellia bacterium]